MELYDHVLTSDLVGQLVVVDTEMWSDLNQLPGS